MKLKAAQVAAAKPRPGATSDVRLSDGGTLYLQIKPGGSKSWVQVLRVNRRRRVIGLGGYPLVSLAEAREKALANRIRARRGEDPAAPKVRTFKQAAEVVIDIQRKSWRAGGRSEEQWRSSLAAYAYPVVGDLPISEITTADVLAVLTPIWHAKRETARRVKHRMSTVMRWAMAQRLRADNPAGEMIDAALPRGGAPPAHHRALPWRDVPDAVRTVRRASAWVGARLCFRFLVLTAARSGEARGCRWKEIDLDGRVWTQPPERTKTRKAHRVPLSPQATAVLAEARAELGGEGAVFPGARGRGPLVDSALRRLLRDSGIPAVPHGFRSSFRDWGAETDAAPREVLEAALAHVVGNRAEAAYARTDHFERRRALMDAWGEFVA